MRPSAHGLHNDHCSIRFSFCASGVKAPMPANTRVGGSLVRNINTRRRDVVDDVQRAFAIVASNLNAAAGEHDGQERLDVEPSKPEH